MNKLYLLDVGFAEPTVLYELEPKVVSRLKNATVDDIVRHLDEKDVRTLVMDLADPFSIQGIRERSRLRKILKTIRLRYRKSE